MKKLTIAILFVLILVVSGCGEEQKDYTVIAQCLTEKGVKMYGAVWCPHCQQQKKMFGDAFKYITYIECDPKTDLESAKRCANDNVEKYPTWRFSDGTEVLGLQDIEQLGLRVGCEMPKEETEEERNTKNAGSTPAK